MPNQICKQADYCRPKPGPNPKAKAQTWREAEKLFEATD